MRKFKVVAGKHHEQGTLFHQGDIVATDNDLNKHNKGKGSIKFEEMPPNTPAKNKPKPRLKQPTLPSIPKKPTVEPVTSTAEEDDAEGIETPDFSSMKVAELKAYAEENEIDLEDATKKADVILAIENSL